MGCVRGVGVGRVSGGRAWRPAARSRPLPALRQPPPTPPLSSQYTRFTVDYMPAHGGDVYVIVLATSAVALSYNVVHSLMIQQTSAVTTTVLGEVKIVGLMVLSATLLGEKKAFTPNMTVGTLVAVAGFCAYSHAKLAASKTPVGGTGADVQLSRFGSEHLARLSSPERGERAPLVGRKAKEVV